MGRVRARAVVVVGVDCAAAVHRVGEVRKYGRASLLAVVVLGVVGVRVIAVVLLVGVVRGVIVVVPVIL